MPYIQIQLKLCPFNRCNKHSQHTVQTMLVYQIQTLDLTQYAVILAQ